MEQDAQMVQQQCKVSAVNWPTDSSDNGCINKDFHPVVDRIREDIRAGSHPVVDCILKDMSNIGIENGKITSASLSVNKGFEYALRQELMTFGTIVILVILLDILVVILMRD